MKDSINTRAHFKRTLTIVLAICMLAACLPLAATAAENQEPTVLKAGSGIADITPTQDMYPLSWGSGGRGYAFIGAAGRIHVRVIAVQNDDGPISLMISVDTGKGPFAPDMMRAIAADTGVEEENIFWSTTHTHSTPENKAQTWADNLDRVIRTGALAETFEDICARNNSRWAKLVQKQLVVASRAAIADLQEAEVGMGVTDSNINVNRDTQFRANPSTTAEGFNGAGPSDKTLTTLEFRNKETGEPIAFIIHYAMHNVLLYANDHFNPDYEGINYKKYDGEPITPGSYDHEDIDDIVPGAEAELNVAYCDQYSYVEYELDQATGVPLTTGSNAGKYSGIVVGNAAVHPDIGGQVSQYVEYNNPGAVALWMSGAAGDQNPILRNCMNYPAPYDMDVGDLKHFDAGSAVELTMKGGLLAAATYYSAIQYVDVKNAINSISEYKSDMPISRAYGETTLERDPAQPATGNVATSYSICLTVMRLGDITFAGSNGELFNNVGVRMREDSIAPNVLVVNHCWPIERSSDNTYYPDDVAIANNSYRWGNNAKYAIGTIYPAMVGLLDDTYTAALNGDEEVNKDELQKLYDEYMDLELKSENYTAESFKAFEDALEAAKNLLDDDDALQSDIDDALTSLKKAYDDLTPVTVTKYTITGSANTGGNVPATTAVIKGGDAAIEVRPNSGYKLAAILVDGVSVDPSDIKNHMYTIENVQNDMALRALFIKDQSSDFAAKFSDVPKTTNGKATWYYTAVDMLVGLNIIEGTTATKYEPGRNVKRSELVKLLYELAVNLGDDPELVTDVPFNDMPSSSYWAKGYIGWAYENKIVEGYNKNEFGPEDNVTRQDMAVMLRRFLVEYMGYDLPGDRQIEFGDAKDISAYAGTAVAYAVRTGLMEGYDDGNFWPKDNSLRSHIAQVLYNYLIYTD